MTGIRVQNISQFGGGAIADGFLKTDNPLNSTNQVIKDKLGNSSLFNLGTQYTGWSNALAGLINDATKDSLSIFKTTTAGGTSNGYKFLVNGLGKIGIGNLGGSYSPTASLDIVGEGSTTATNAIIIKNASGNVLWRVTDGNTSYWNSKLLSPGGEGLQSGGNSTGHLQILPASIGIRSYMDSASKSFLINTTDGWANEASAFFQLDSTTRGILLPRMTTTQRNAISSPANSLTVFDTDLDTICFYSSAAGGWRQVSNSAA